MSVFVGADTTLVVQGITGREGTFHTLRNRAYGTQVVAGVTPGKAGADVEGIPVFDTVVDAVRETGANTSMIFVPPRFAAEAILEAADAGVGLVVCITEGIPVLDMANVHSYLKGVGTTNRGVAGAFHSAPNRHHRTAENEQRHQRSSCGAAASCTLPRVRHQNRLKNPRVAAMYLRARSGERPDVRH